MTGPLLRVTTTPYQSVRVSQNARLVPSDSVDLERRKAIARLRAFQSQKSPGSGNVDISYVNQINRTFSLQQSQQSTAPSPRNSSGTVGSGLSESSNTTAVSAAASSSDTVASSDVAVQTSVAPETISSQDMQKAISTESDSAYTMDRGAFEFRVAKGEVAFLPPLVMTVMTQRPEVHIEYLGGHNYVPPDSFDDNGFINLLA
ncbi:MAG: hypothetical protein HFI63_08245 [Lachnospiraceae bacterium]|nr:hypothetical protein [Lachnospiraceae bacterium]